MIVKLTLPPGTPHVLCCDTDFTCNEKPPVKLVRLAETLQFTPPTNATISVPKPAGEATPVTVIGSRFVGVGVAVGVGVGRPSLPSAVAAAATLMRGFTRLPAPDRVSVIGMPVLVSAVKI